MKHWGGKDSQTAPLSRFMYLLQSIKSVRICAVF
jgi:hypothetical protein